MGSRLGSTASTDDGRHEVENGVVRIIVIQAKDGYRLWNFQNECASSRTVPPTRFGTGQRLTSRLVHPGSTRSGTTTSSCMSGWRPRTAMTAIRGRKDYSVD